MRSNFLVNNMAKTPVCTNYEGPCDEGWQIGSSYRQDKIHHRGKHNAYSNQKIHDRFLPTRKTALYHYSIT